MTNANAAAGAVPDYLALSDEELLAQCRLDRFRASGPGGQKRNKTDSAVRLRHKPTGLTAQAVESRSQHQNRSKALQRLRETIALELRRPVELEEYHPPPALQAILPSGAATDAVPKQQRVGRRHRDYWPGVQAFFDLFVAVDGSMAETAERIGVSTGRLSRLMTRDPHLLRAANRIRKIQGLRPLR